MNTQRTNWRQPSTLRRGRLRIYFGASPGAGKTYAMLVAARKLADSGRDVLVGVAEAHGRADTVSLLESLEMLTPNADDSRHTASPEFDLDEVLMRRPALVLIGQLAHSNPAGRRHPKRWQDIDELLSSGIDVFTTMNVLHLESLNDVIHDITHVKVRETVPDKMFNEADEVVLVDLPAEELSARLEESEEFVEGSAEFAGKPGFHRGSLMALRELALRRTADRVRADLQAFRADESIKSVWKTATALLTCVGPENDAQRIVRAAAELAAQLNAHWHAIYIETPALQRLPAVKRERILATLNLAQSLGATTAVIANAKIAQSVIAYARAHNLSKLVIGRNPGRRLWPWQRSSGQELAILAPDVDLIEIGRAEVFASQRTSQHAAPIGEGASRDRQSRHWSRYLWATLACVVVTLLSMPLAAHFDRSNIMAIFILAVVLVAVRLGRGPAALAAVLAVCAFDYFFVPPRFSFAVADVQYLLTFLIMLIVGLIAGQLTAGLRFQARVATAREERSRSLYEMARDLSGAMAIDQVIAISTHSIEQTFRTCASLLLPDVSGQLRVAARELTAPSIEIGIAQWAFSKGQAAGFGTDTLPGSQVLYIPLRAPSEVRGVLALESNSPRLLRIPEQRQLLDTFAALIAIALERVHYVEVAQVATVSVESERLRNSLLAALSHDLRTPLAVLAGFADSLVLAKPALAVAHCEAAQSIKDGAMRMSALVSNLLDMARIESGKIKLTLQWQLLEEVVGTSLAAVRDSLAKHILEVRLPRDLPLVKFDAVLIERVLVNLLENSSKYSPPGSTVRVSAEIFGGYLNVSVSDNGPGLPIGREKEIFKKFTRGARESATPGVGLGLAICRAIVESHQGTIIGMNRPNGGAAITFTLPLGDPPSSLLEPQPERP